MSGLPALLYAEAVLKMLVRSGVVEHDEVLVMADEIDGAADSNPAETEEHREAAHQLRATLLTINPPAPAGEFQAQQRRAAMRERTALLADGGNRDD